jgi:uncharacterized membrane protein YccC
LTGVIDSPQLRASGAEREHAAEEIREHFAAGRLTPEELSQRLDAAYAAKTVGELVALRGDLPALPPSAPARRAELVQRRTELRRRLLQQTVGSFSVFFLCALIWLASGASSPFWPVWVAIFPVVALARNGWGMYGPAPDLDRVERELNRRSRHRGRGSRHRRELRP